MSEQTLDPHVRSLYPGQDWNRRSFLVTSLSAGFALAVQPVSAQTITTDSNDLTAGEVKVPVKDGEIPAYRAMPASGGSFATVIVVDRATTNATPRTAGRKCWHGSRSTACRATTGGTLGRP